MRCGFRPFAALGHEFKMLRCCPSIRTFVATVKSARANSQTADKADLTLLDLNGGFSSAHPINDYYPY